jgi:hypothetical protein
METSQLSSLLLTLWAQRWVHLALQLTLAGTHIPIKWVKQVRL